MTKVTDIKIPKQIPSQNKSLINFKIDFHYIRIFLIHFFDKF